MDKIEKQVEHFDEIAEIYHNARRNPNLIALKRKIWASAFRKFDLWNLNQKESKLKVCEAMCGFGDGYEILKWYLPLDFSYSGFDYSREMIGYASKNYPSGHFHVQNVLDFGSDESYDLIILIGGLHHVHASAEQAMRQLSGTIRPGGIFINFEPTNNNILLRWIRERIYRKNKIFDENTEMAFQTHQLHEIACRCGFEIVDELYPGLLAYVMWYNPDAFPLLNVGSPRIVSALSGLESFLWRTSFARYFSFATLTVYRKR
ncbi:MAG: class I SAM-dependent methyltransferase [Synergistaceae bacterium]|jgi:2-polyprenyl-3-methyl-5-hydroxy-6-metoxy-1,4-benzoquinol methylase|nr:class I SAM-dependent methyltransferase [Synergistaceae bacterium]